MDPIVPSVVLDCFMRSQSSEEDQYVVGALLGYQEGGLTQVTNCFQISFKSQKRGEMEESKEVRFVMDNNWQKMKTLLTKGTNEEIVGLFYVPLNATQASTLTDIALLQSFNMNKTERKRAKNYLLLKLDPKFQNSDSLGMRIYQQIDLGFSDLRNDLGVLSEVPFEVRTRDMRESGLETIVYGQDHYDILGIFTSELRDKDVSLKELSSKQKLFSTSKLLELSIENVVKGIESCRAHISRVQKGELPPNPQVASLLHAAIEPLKKIQASEVEALLREHYQDLLFV